MKRVLALLSALQIAALVFGGCSERAESSSEETASSAAETVTAQTEKDPEIQDIPEEEDALYDTSPISQAYLTGDETGLDDEQLTVLSKAREILAEIVTEDMTDYEKELAVHDYLITNCEYDTKALSVFGTPSEGSDRPYGALINGESICAGYTTTFQMFMDILGIGCVSIKATDDEGEEHAWNQVELDGKYYYVDVTWDDPVPDTKNGMIRHDYFNVTEAEMKKRHVWDSSEMAPADGGEDSYIAHNLNLIAGDTDADAVQDILEESVEKRAQETYFRFETDLGDFLGRYEDEDAVKNSSLPKKLREKVKAFEKDHKDLYVYCECREYEGGKLLVISMQKYS